MVLDVPIFKHIRVSAKIEAVKHLHAVFSANRKIVNEVMKSPMFDQIVESLGLF